VGAGSVAPTVSAFVTAGAGFLIAVLWFDLMFDVQVIGRRGGVLPEEVLASIARYYARVTTAARPMNRLVAAVMLAVLGAIVVEIARGGQATWVGWSSLAIVGPTLVFTATRIVPSAVRLGTRPDPPERQSVLARAVLHGHLACLAAMASLLGIQLAFG
jgi:hypothetical protein